MRTHGCLGMVGLFAAILVGSVALLNGFLWLEAHAPPWHIVAVASLVAFPVGGIPVAWVGHLLDRRRERREAANPPPQPPPKDQPPTPST